MPTEAPHTTDGEVLVFGVVRVEPVSKLSEEDLLLGRLLEGL